MSWAPQNLYNLWRRTVGPRADDLRFRITGQTTLFQQRWKSKALVRAYHGDFIPEKIFKRWYLPETLPDVRPARYNAPAGDDKGALEEFAKRKRREREYEEDVERKGMAPVGSLMVGEVERRIDVVVFRCCFAHSVYEARRLVVHGDVYLNGKKHTNANTRLAPGDMITVNPDAIRFFKKLPTEQDDIIARYFTPKKTEAKEGEDDDEGVIRLSIPKGTYSSSLHSTSSSESPSSEPESPSSTSTSPSSTPPSTTSPSTSTEVTQSKYTPSPSRTTPPPGSSSPPTSSPNSPHAPPSTSGTLPRCSQRRRRGGRQRWLLPYLTYYDHR
ncbi:hypothetical protein NMY22_g19942 [Coprinellus aureogranulatus]|nr:hypothetical protein NMY22_g19942 [Coprinellus aureogranulatus]